MRTPLTNLEDNRLIALYLKFELISDIIHLIDTMVFIHNICKSVSDLITWLANRSTCILNYLTKVQIQSIQCKI